MSYNNSATVYITNNTGGNAIITFSHRYSDDPVQVYPPTKIQPGQSAGPLEVGYNTGFLRSGTDQWFCGVQVLDGPQSGTFSSEGSIDNPIKQCTLESEDNGLTLTFSVTTSNFVMTENSGTCSTSMNAANAAAASALKQPKRLSGSDVKVAAE